MYPLLDLKLLKKEILDTITREIRNRQYALDQWLGTTPTHVLREELKQLKCIRQGLLEAR